ncbi:MAG: MacB family efflux pump subunit [Paracoccus sp. (in: a-proteobacteria)]|nr:MacB family efflux pump subunit [Paracoccus sp. (in: a-proteobacteria)]
MTAAGDAPLISVRGISRSFPAGEDRITVLADVDLDIWPGEFVAIMGASGSGKSTLMNILGCLDRATTGSYRFAGRDVGTLDPDEQARLRREHFGFIFQRYQLLGDLDAIGNTEVPAIYAGESRAARRRRATDLLNRLGLGERLDHRPGQLSGGQQQRVSIARALMNGGEVILADEPTGALDSKSSAEMIRLLEDLNRDGHTIIMVTHDPKVAAHARRTIEISDGRIIADSGRVTTGAPPVAPRRETTGFSALTRLREAFGMGAAALMAHRMRSFLTMLGIIIGIASVVLVVGLGTGTQEKVLQDISSLGTNTITIRAGSGFGSRDAARIETLVPSDAGAIALQDYAAGVSPAVSSPATVRFGNVSASAMVSGVSNDYFALHSYDTVSGSLFDAADITELAQFAIIDEDTATTLFGVGADPVGQVVHLGRVPARVIGTVRQSGASFGPSSLNVWLPYTTVMSRVSGQTYLDSITVQIADGYDTQRAQDDLTTLLRTRHGAEDFFMMNSDTIRQTITSTTQTLTVLVAAIAVISLLVGGIGVMNIMLVSVTERTKEIGVRIAIGARRSDIIAQFLIEAVLVCIIGGTLGILLAVGTASLIASVAPIIPLTISTLSIAVAFLSSTLIGITFGFLPARSAAQLDPVVALSRE